MHGPHPRMPCTSCLPTTIPRASWNPFTTTDLLHALPVCPHPEGVPADKARVSALDRVLPTVQGHKKWNDDVLLSESLLRSDSAPFELPCLPPLSDAPDSDDETGPFGYSRFTQDPSHRGETMSHALQPEWIKTENLEMVWERVL